ncbi:hypothetical protein BDV19DRAFT_391513 [Aspergillus venezuelensis]
MVEPFSIASGAAGVVSLGLTVCQGLLAYYGPFKAEALQQLSNVLSRCRGYDAGGTLTKKGRAFAKALYPFRRGTLVGLTDVVAGIQSNLEVALQVLMLAITGQLEQRSILSLSVSHSIASNIAEVPSSLERLDTGQQRLMQSQEQMLQLVTRMQHMQHVALEQTPNAQQGPLIRQPELNGSRRQHSWHQGPVRHLSRWGGSPASQVQCTCNGTRSWVSRVFGFISSIHSHRYDCPLFHHREVATLVDGKLTILTRCINCSVYFHVALVQEKAAFSIQPILNLRRVVDIDSPSFEIIRSTISKNGMNYAEALLRLRSLFDEGKASPSDTLPDGRTLVHEAIHFLGIVPISEVPSFIQFVTEVVIQCHVPVNDSFYNRTALDLLILGPDPVFSLSIIHDVNVTEMRPKTSPFFAAADVALARLATLLLDNGATVTLGSPSDRYALVWLDDLQFRSFRIDPQNDYLVGMVKVCGVEGEFSECCNE